MKTPWKTSSRFVGWFLAICAAVGLLASFTLLHETFEVAKNPSYSPSCNLSVFVSCTGAMSSDYANLLFGIPNPALGIAMFTALFVFGVLIISGARFKPWIWLAGIGATLFGLGLTTFFYFESLLVLGTICPWCAVTWVVTIATFWIILTHSLAAKQITIPKRFKKAADFWVQYASVILAVLYVALVFGILFRFNEALFV